MGLQGDAPPRQQRQQRRERAGAVGLEERCRRVGEGSALRLVGLELIEHVGEEGPPRQRRAGGERGGGKGNLSGGDVALGGVAGDGGEARCGAGRVVCRRPVASARELGKRTEPSSEPLLAPADLRDDPGDDRPVAGSLGRHDADRGREADVHGRFPVGPPPVRPGGEGAQGEQRAGGDRRPGDGHDAEVAERGFVSLGDGAAKLPGVDGQELVAGGVPADASQVRRGGAGGRGVPALHEAAHPRGRQADLPVRRSLDGDHAEGDLVRPLRRVGEQVLGGHPATDAGARVQRVPVDDRLLEDGERAELHAGCGAPPGPRQRAGGARVIQPRPAPRLPDEGEGVVGNAAGDLVRELPPLRGAGPSPAGPDDRVEKRDRVVDGLAAPAPGDRQARGVLGEQLGEPARASHPGTVREQEGGVVFPRRHGDAVELLPGQRAPQFPEAHRPGLPQRRGEPGGEMGVGGAERRESLLLRRGADVVAAAQRRRRWQRHLPSPGDGPP